MNVLAPHYVTVSWIPSWTQVDRRGHPGSLAAFVASTSDGTPIDEAAGISVYAFDPRRDGGAVDQRSAPNVPAARFAPFLDAVRAAENVGSPLREGDRFDPDLLMLQVNQYGPNKRTVRLPLNAPAAQHLLEAVRQLDAGIQWTPVAA